MKYYVVGNTVEISQQTQPTEATLNASFLSVIADDIIPAFTSQAAAECYRNDQFEQTDKLINPIFEIEASGRYQIQIHQLKKGQKLSGIEIPVGDVTANQALVNLANKKFQNVALAGIKEAESDTKQREVEDQQPKKGFFKTLYNILLSKYVQIPMLAINIAMQGSAAQMVNGLAKIGIITPFPLLLEIGLALALSVVCYAAGQVVISGLKSAYNAISPRISNIFAKSQTVDQPADEINPELIKKAEVVRETVLEAANDDNIKKDNNAQLEDTSNVIRMSAKGASKNTTEKFSPRASESDEPQCAMEPEAKSCCCPKKK